MWILRCPRTAFEIWIGKWITIAECLVGICTLCLYQPNWWLVWSIRNTKRKLSRRG